jgi:hypothetical protein
MIVDDGGDSDDYGKKSRNFVIVFIVSVILWIIFIYCLMS